MDELLRTNRIGTALRKMAEDLVAERRRVALLTRENAKLREQLESFQRSSPEPLEPAIEAREGRIGSRVAR